MTNMKKYLILLPLLLFAFCTNKPHKGEIWRNAVPYTMDVKVDSVVDNQLVMYSWDSLTHKLKGDNSGNFMRFVDSIVHVRGFKVGEVGLVNHIIQLTPYVVPGSTKLKEGGSKVLVIDSPGVNDGGFKNPMPSAGILDSGTFSKSAKIYFRKVTIDEDWPVEIMLTSKEGERVEIMTNEHYKILKLVNLFTKKQLDSTYRKGVRDERKRFGYILDDGANSPEPMQTNGWTKLMELADTLHPHKDTASFRKWNEMLDSSRNGFIEKPSPTRALLLRIKKKIPTFNMDSGRIILD